MRGYYSFSSALFDVQPQSAAVMSTALLHWRVSEAGVPTPAHAAVPVLMAITAPLSTINLFALKVFYFDLK